MKRDRMSSFRIQYGFGAFRGNSDFLNGYVLESMLDEAAHVSGRDPLEYRLSILTHDPRSAAVLRRIGQLAGCKVAAASGGRYQGLAFYLIRIPIDVGSRPSSNSPKVLRVFGSSAHLRYLIRAW